MHERLQWLLEEVVVSTTPDDLAMNLPYEYAVRLRDALLLRLPPDSHEEEN